MALTKPEKWNLIFFFFECLKPKKKLRDKISFCFLMNFPVLCRQKVHRENNSNIPIILNLQRSKHKAIQRNQDGSSRILKCTLKFLILKRMINWITDNLRSARQTVICLQLETAVIGCCHVASLTEPPGYTCKFSLSVTPVRENLFSVYIRKVDLSRIRAGVQLPF